MRRSWTGAIRCRCPDKQLRTLHRLSANVHKFPFREVTPNTPNFEELQFESIVELARWAAINALQKTLVRTSQ
jgi:hypothetical protein